MNNAGMDGYSYESDSSHREMHYVTETLIAEDAALARVTCACGWRTRSRLLSDAMGKHTEHAGGVVVAAEHRKIGAEAMSA